MTFGIGDNRSMKVLAVKNRNKQHRLLECDSIKWEEVREKIRKKNKKIRETKLNNGDLIKRMKIRADLRNHFSDEGKRNSNQWTDELGKS